MGKFTLLNQLINTLCEMSSGEFVGVQEVLGGNQSSSSSLLLSSLELSETKVYEPYMQALLGTPAHFREVVVLESTPVPIGTALGSRILRVIRRGAQAMYKCGASNSRRARPVH